MGEIKQETKKSGISEKKNKIKQMLCLALLAAVIGGCGGGYYYFSIHSNYFTTDNAKVTAKMYTVGPVTSGKLLEWDVETGDLVDKDQILGRQETLPFITSPISGTVVKNDGAVNQMAAPGAALAVVADTEHMYIGVNIEETEIAKIHTGQDVDIKIDAYPGKTFHGQVTEIDPATQTYFSGTASFSTSGTYTKVTQLIPVKVTLVDSEEPPMAFGMNATVKIHLK